MANRFEASVAKAAPVALRSFPLTCGGVSITYGTELPIILNCRVAGFSNPGMSTAIMKATAERRRIAALTDEREKLIATWKLDAKTHVHTIESWANVVEKGADGKDVPVPVTLELAEELLLAIIASNVDLFLAWKQWVNTDANFVETPPGDPADLGK